MKSTKDNRPAVKFSDIVKELHSYANSEQAVIDFASELEKVINLSEEFELSQYYFEDNDAKNYLRKKLNFKSVILTGIKSSTTTISNIKDDFFEIYKNCYHKYVKSGNPFFNRLSIMYDLNLYYDIEQKKFVIYEATNVGYPGDFEFYSKKDFYGTYINRVDSIFPVSISDRGQNSNLLFIRPMDSLESIPMSITCNFDVVLLKYISGLIDTKEFSAEFLKDINSYIESVVKKYLKLPNETLDENILSSYPAAIFTENDLVKIMSRTLFDNETYNDLSGIFENRKNNEYICSFLEKLLDPSVTAPSKILSLIATNPIFEFEKLPGLKSENKKELLIKLMSKSSGKISTTLLSYFNNDELYEMFKNTTVHQLKKMANNKKVVFQKDKSNNLLIGKRIVYFDEPIQDITFSENQLTEFKSEIIPLLEKIRDEVLYKAPSNNFSVIKGEIGDKSSLLVKLLMDNYDYTTHSFVPYLQNMFGIIPNKFDLFFDGNLSEYAKEELLDFLAVDDIINFENLNILITESDCNINTTRIGYKYNSKIVKLLNKQDYDNLALLADYGSGIRCPIFFKKIKIG